MNDPHVKTIHYRINHAPGVSYANATPLTVDTERDFSVQIDKLNAEIEMKTHYPTEEGARQVVERFLRTWELSTGLLNPSDGFRFEFLSAEIIDRAPTPGGTAQAGMYGVGGVDTNSFVTRNYPTPPVGLGWDADIDLMFERFRMQEGKRTTISDAAYFCLTVLVSAFTRAEVGTDRVSKPTSSRGKAAQHFRIDLPVLDKIGNLTGNRGGRLSRKKQGTEHPLTPGEEEWLKGALRLVIRRVAQVAGDPRGTYDLITMADLPVLPDRF